MVYEEFTKKIYHLYSRYGYIVIKAIDIVKSLYSYYIVSRYLEYLKTGEEFIDDIEVYRTALVTKTLENIEFNLYHGEHPEITSAEIKSLLKLAYPDKTDEEIKEILNEILRDIENELYTILFQCRKYYEEKYIPEKYRKLIFHD